MRAVDDLTLTILCLACSLSLLTEVFGVSATFRAMTKRSKLEIKLS